MRILITGGGSDIGCAIAARRLALGDSVIITASSAASLEQARTRYRAQGLDVDGVVFDLAQPEHSAGDLDRLLAGGVDGLVLNAWTRRPPIRRFHDMHPGAVKADVHANVLGNCWLIQRVLPGMVARRLGRVVLVSSVSTVNGTGRYGTYVMCKAAMEGLMRNLAMDYGPDGVLANTVRLGIIKTERTRAFWSREDYVARMSGIIPQGALGEPADVAAALDPLLAERQYVNGAVLDVSGGLPMFRLDGGPRS